MAVTCEYSYLGQSLFTTNIETSADDPETLLAAAKQIRHAFVEALNRENHSHVNPDNVEMKLHGIGENLPVWEMVQTFRIKIAAKTEAQAIKFAPRDFKRWHADELTIHPAKED